jgi:hypothetical protein
MDDVQKHNSCIKYLLLVSDLYKYPYTHEHIAATHRSNSMVQHLNKEQVLIEKIKRRCALMKLKS